MVLNNEEDEKNRKGFHIYLNPRLVKRAKMLLIRLDEKEGYPKHKSGLLNDLLDCWVNKTEKEIENGKA